MNINGTIFSKPQQDQLKRAIASGGSGLNYKGDWASGNEYHENDVVTYSGDLYYVVQSGISNTTPDATPSMYKAMTNPSVNNTLIPVYFDTQGGHFGSLSTPENRRCSVLIELVPVGTLCAPPQNVVKSGKSFDAWYTDPIDESNEFNFLSTPITAPLVLYAHWV